MERMNPTGLLVLTVEVARHQAFQAFVRCSSQLVPPPRLYQDCAPACTSAGNAADVTTARLERLLRLGTWQEGKRSVPQATWFLPLLLFAPLLLALCAVLHVFLDGWTEWPLPSCQVAKLASWQTNPLRGCLWSVYCLFRRISDQNEPRCQCVTKLAKILHATNLLIKKSA